MKILVTGFTPFGNETINPSHEAVRKLPDKIGEHRIVKRQLPTSFQKVGELARRAMEEEKPDFILCVGQNGGAAEIRLEKVAINYMDAKLADNDGNICEDVPINPKGKTGYFSPLPLKEMKDNLNENKIPAAISLSAGAYVCNCLYYQVLAQCEENKADQKGLFVHVPYIPEQVLDKRAGTPSMELEEITKALTYICRFCVNL